MTTHDHDDTDMTPKEFEERIAAAPPAEIYTSKDDWKNRKRPRDLNKLAASIIDVTVTDPNAGLAVVIELKDLTIEGNEFGLNQSKVKFG